jgi:hypothetical protein
LGLSTPQSCVWESPSNRLLEWTKITEYTMWFECLRPSTNKILIHQIKTQ